jgi:hypothetical protein
MEYLIKMGIPQSKLCYVSPAHDETVKIKKIKIGITCRVQEDGRKRESILFEIGKSINPNLFSFTIMGDGWQYYVDQLRKLGFEVEYHDSFDYNKYMKIIPTLDYYLYMGMDEGQMGFIDALAAGVEPIVTNQGYHLDTSYKLKYGFKTKKELLKIFEEIENEKLNKINSIENPVLFVHEAISNPLVFK